MKKNDKLVALLGVIILIVASIGIYVWAPQETEDKIVEANDLMKITGNLVKQVPNGVLVSNSSPFYPLITTPLTLHYDSNGEQELIPLLVADNVEKPSRSIDRVIKDLNLFNLKKIDDSKNPKEVSLEIASDYWENSKAAIIIENNQSGYELGVIATPLASYLSIPIIVTDEIDNDVTEVLMHLGVEYTLLCGEHLKEYGNSLIFEDVDHIVDTTIQVLENKFRKIDPNYEVDYITLTNPVDAWEPKVLDSEEYFFGPETVQSASMNRGSTLEFMTDFFNKISWEFEIPEDYKYALIEIDGYNHELGGVDEFGDSASFDINPVGEGLTLGSVSTLNGIAKRDAKGNIIEDSVHTERVMYDSGGKSYTLSSVGSWTLKEEGKVSAHVKVKKLEHPVYPLMKGLSSIAPYLTAYHKGIVFGKSDFAFTADDEVLTDDGKTCPGYYLPGRNPDLFPIANKHIYDNIHVPLNELLAKLSDVSYEKNTDLKYLTDYYRNNPVYIALVGGSVVLPRYFYQNHVEPIGDIDGDGVDDTVALPFGGGGTQSDNIYGNIDPIKHDWSNQAGDKYSNSEYPYVENIVGRITGWNVQEADALVVRTLFYDEIIDDISGWKDNYGNLFGGGLDFRKPLRIQILNRIPGISQILSLVNQLTGGMLNLADGPWKYETGFGEIIAQAVEDEIGEDLGFEVSSAVEAAAMIDGYSDKALDQMKTTSLWNRLTFPKSKVKELAGDGNTQGREILENSNFIWATGHGSPYSFGMDGPDLVATGFDGLILRAPNLWQKIWKNIISPHFVVGFWGPGGNLGKVGSYTPRLVSTVDLGPSFMWLESCFCGRITGVYPQANIGQTFIHSGVNSLIASTTGSNIPGGYLPGKDHMWDTKLGTRLREREWQNKAEQGEYPEFHFGMKIYNDLSHELIEKDSTVGEAFRNAKNRYLPEDADWELWWSPPLTSSSGESGYGQHLSAKYTSFQEYVLYGDPAFNPYDPVNEGGKR